MKQEFQNFEDFIQEMKLRGERPIFFYRSFCKQLRSIGISLTPGAVGRYAHLDSKPTDKKISALLSQITGIPEENLFRFHDDD